MYRTLIVDDEPEIRMGLKLKVDWDRLNATAAGEASNGAEALDFMDNEPIDIMIADMNMPVMNGVELLEACRGRFPGVKVIVLTGYEDFHYAKAAVKNRARDFLLKPVTQDELMVVMERVISELDEERKEQREQAVVQWRLSQYFKDMKEHFISRIVREEPERERDLIERAGHFELETWHEKQVRFVTAGLRERSAAYDGSAGRTPDKFRLPFELLCREFAETYPAPVRPQVFRDDHYPGLLHFILEDAGDEVASFTAALRSCIAERLAFEPLIGIGQPVAGFKRWKEGCISSLLDWNMSESGKMKAKDQADPKPVLTEDTAKLIQRQLLRGELDAFRQTLHNELADAFGASQARFVKLIAHLYFLLDSLAQTAGVPLSGGEQLWIRPDTVLALDTVQKAEAFLLRLGTKIYRDQADAEDPDNSVIENARQFIEQHYMYDLNLGMLAEKFSYNRSYFSELFKAKVGTSFIQYVTDVRMEKATRLLKETKLGLWDIAELTGFSNPSYFSSKFKRMYGVSPSEYRNANSDKG
ncbi:response regulator transcription factor [Paenibacillus humicola]|uniref:response regulator transcription factor n=1 Tax=Paenibacillus humicola TaxID=3110540 RepID=UPI00237A5E2F|nr:helix-turn-helix domain-containing protein [Paenibacillus humicola]